MARAWIDGGLAGQTERQQRWRLARERRRRETVAIEETGPQLMRELVAEMAEAVQEYERKKPAGSDPVAFEALPHQGFRVEQGGHPGVVLECRPDYAAHLIYCNMTSGEGRDDTETREQVFSLRFIVGDGDRVALAHDDRQFSSVADLAEYLLTPVLFPEPEPHP